MGLKEIISSIWEIWKFVLDKKNKIYKWEYKDNVNCEKSNKGSIMEGRKFLEVVGRRFLEEAMKSYYHH